MTFARLSSHRNFGNGSDLMPYRRAGAHPSLSLGTTIARPIKKAIAANVIGQFNDRSRGDKPVVRRTDGLFAQGPSLGAFMATSPR